MHSRDNKGIHSLLVKDQRAACRKYHTSLLISAVAMTPIALIRTLSTHSYLACNSCPFALLLFSLRTDGCAFIRW